MIAPHDVLASSPFVQMVIPGQERVIAWADCPSCNGKGHFVHDNWITLRVEGQDYGKANFGRVRMCTRCKGGKIASHWYTRGVGLVPLIGRKRNRLIAY